MLTLTNVPAHSLKIGDEVMPPAREIHLWMRRHITERNLPESALLLTIRKIDEALPDKRGRWLSFTTDQSDQWNEDRPRRFPFCFRARPDTPWPKTA
jgi:hypothetical protein